MSAASITKTRRDWRGTMETLGSRLRHRRKEKKLTQVQLADRAGITQPTLSAIERNQTETPYGPTLLRLAAALECSPLWLQEGKGPVTIQADAMTGTELQQLMSSLSITDQATLLAVARTIFRKP